MTDKGKIVVASSLPVALADILQADIEEARRTGVIFAADHLHSLFLAAPRGFYYPGKWSSEQWPALKHFLQGTLHADDALLLTRLGFEGQDVVHYRPGSNLPAQRVRGELLQRLHAALVLRALAREKPLDEICSRFGFETESDVVRLQEAGSRSLYAAAAMCESRGNAELQVVFSRLQQRVVAGTQQELVELADVEGMRRGYARVFYSSGIQTLDMLVAQTPEKVAEVLAKVNPNQRTLSPRLAKRQAEKLLTAARAAVAERDRRNRQETLAKLAAQGLGGEALQLIADKLDAAAEAAAQSGAVSAQSPEASAAALEAAAEREKQMRASLVAAAAVVDPQPPLPPAPPPLPQCSPPDFAFDAAIAAASAQLGALSGAVVLGDDDAVEFEALLRALCAAPLYGFSFAVRADGPAPRAITVLGLALALRPGGVAFVSFDGRGGTARRDALAAVLAQPGPAKAALHVKEQIKALAHAAQPQDTPAACLAALGAGAEDAFICAYLLAPDREKDGDKPTTFKLLDVAGVTHAGVMAAARFRAGAPQPPPAVQEAALAAAAALAVRGPLRAALEAAGGLHVPLAEVEMPLVPVLAAMELLGVPFRSGDLDDPLQMATMRLEGACFDAMRCVRCIFDAMCCLRRAGEGDLRRLEVSIAAAVVSEGCVVRPVRAQRERVLAAVRRAAGRQAAERQAPRPRCALVQHQEGDAAAGAARQRQGAARRRRRLRPARVPLAGGPSRVRLLFSLLFIRNLCRTDALHATAARARRCRSRAWAPAGCTAPSCRPRQRRGASPWTSPRCTTSRTRATSGWPPRRAGSTRWRCAPPSRPLRAACCFWQTTGSLSCA